MLEEQNLNEAEKTQLNIGAVMPRFIKLGGVQIEQPDADGDFEITIKDNDSGEVYRYLTIAQAQKMVDFISHYSNEV